MFLKISAVAAAIGLLFSYLIFTITRTFIDVMAFETYDKFRYIFRASYYLADILSYFPMIVFFIAFYISLRKDRAARHHDAPTLHY